jgi:DNA polymerase-1
MEDEFKQQIPLVKDLVAELWIPSLAFPWYEADDIIYSLVENYKEDKSLNFQVYTSDKDLKQFLSDNIVIVDSMKNQTTTLLDFWKEYGFEPVLIIDYLALIWDHADNVKWVEWIGPKKALNLVQTYWTIENIYEHLDELTPDLRSKLENDRESAFFSKHLIQLMYVDDLKWAPIENYSFSIDFNKWEDILLKKWEFNSMSKLFQELKKTYTQPQQLGLF